MTQLEKTIQAARILQEELNILNDSGELIEDIQDQIGKVVWLIDTLDDYLPAPENKKNLITGDFRLLNGGYFDFKETGIFTIEIFGRQLSLTVENARKEFQEFLNRMYGVHDSDIIMNEWIIDTTNDTLQFWFAFQTDLNFETPQNEISLITSKKLSLGSFHQNKVIFRSQLIKSLPSKLWEWPCYGVAIPYSLVVDILELLDNIQKSADHNGDVADIRAISAYYKDDIIALVTSLQAKQWKYIYTSIGRWKLMPNGSGAYVRY